MATTSAFAAQFPEAQFRDAIHQTMKMGMPELDSEKLIWRWNRERTYALPDQSGQPLIFGVAEPLTDDPGNPTGDAEDDGVIVDYALEDDNASDTGTTVGVFNQQRVKVTVFDDDFEKIRTADYAMIGDVRYEIRFWAPPYGLFGVTMHDIHLEAKDTV